MGTERSAHNAKSVGQAPVSAGGGDGKQSGWVMGHLHPLVEVKDCSIFPFISLLLKRKWTPILAEDIPWAMELGRDGLVFWAVFLWEVLQTY